MFSTPILLLSSHHHQRYEKNTGTGIPQQIQDKVFDPFFTTKPIGTGTGIGLSLAYQTVKKYQGNIFLRSDGQSGTEFIIDLPTP